MKVSLVKIPTFEAPKSLSYFGSVPSLGLAYVAAAIRAAGHEIQVVDSPGEGIARYGAFPTSVGSMRIHGLSMGEIVDRIDPAADVIGIGNMFLHEWNFIREFVPLIRSRIPGAMIALGGETATAWWPHILSACPEIDACVLGEGEEAATRLLEAAGSGTGLGSVPGIAYRANGVPGRTAPAARIRAIDEIPWPAWDLFPLENYLAQELGSGVNRGRSLPMLTSRGCPYLCSFCSSPEMWTTRYYARDPEKVADEIQFYIERYGIRNVNFNDLTAVLTKKWAVRFCRIIQERGMRFTWQLPSGTRCEAVDREVAGLLFDSGCRNFGYAPESGSPRILRAIRKQLKIPSLLGSLRDALRAGLNTQANIVIGFPQETFGDLLRSYGLILKMAWSGLHTLSVMVFSPYPGSEEYRRLVSTGSIAIDDKYVFSTLLRSGSTLKSFNRRFGAGTLVAIQFWFLLSFYFLQYLFRPNRAVRVLVNLLRKRQENVMEQFLTSKLRQIFQKT